MKIENVMVQNKNSFPIRIVRANIPFRGEDAEEQDTFEVPKDTQGKLSVEQRQLMLHESKITASGWSALLGGLSTLYYGLRSNATIAEKFNLNVKEDGDLIKNIRKEQIIATLPSVIGHFFFGVGHIVPGGLAWLYFRNIEDPKNQKI